MWKIDGAGVVRSRLTANQLIIFSAALCVRSKSGLQRDKCFMLPKTDRCDCHSLEINHWLLLPLGACADPRDPTRTDRCSSGYKLPPRAVSRRSVEGTTRAHSSSITQGQESCRVAKRMDCEKPTAYFYEYISDRGQ